MEASEGAMLSEIMGYGKGKVPEKHMCTNCLCKGIKCEWDEGGHSEFELIFFFDFGSTTTGKSCQLCQRQKIRCTLRGLGPLSAKRPRTEEIQTPRPPKKPRSELVVVVRVLKKPEVYLKVKRTYLFQVQMVSLIKTPVLEMVK